MIRKRVHPPDGSVSSAGAKKQTKYDFSKATDVLILMNDELAVLDKVMYTQRNQHRNCIYYRSMKKVCFLLTRFFEFVVYSILSHGLCICYEHNQPY